MKKGDKSHLIIVGLLSLHDETQKNKYLHDSAACRCTFSRSNLNKWFPIWLHQLLTGSGSVLFHSSLKCGFMSPTHKKSHTLDLNVFWSNCKKLLFLQTIEVFGCVRTFIHSYVFRTLRKIFFSQKILLISYYRSTTKSPDPGVVWLEKKALQRVIRTTHPITNSQLPAACRIYTVSTLPRNNTW